MLQKTFQPKYAYLLIWRQLHYMDSWGIIYSYKDAECLINDSAMVKNMAGKGLCGENDMQTVLPLKQNTTCSISKWENSAARWKSKLPRCHLWSLPNVEDSDWNKSNKSDCKKMAVMKKCSHEKAWWEDVDSRWESSHEAIYWVNEARPWITAWAAAAKTNFNKIESIIQECEPLLEWKQRPLLNWKR